MGKGAFMPTNAQNEQIEKERLERDKAKLDLESVLEIVKKVKEICPALSDQEALSFVGASFNKNVKVEYIIMLGDPRIMNVLSMFSGLGGPRKKKKPKQA
jgi:hypothetical protein